MKKLLCFALALLLCLSLFPAAAFAETDAPEKEPSASPDSASRDDPEAGTDALPSTDEPQDLVASGDCGDYLTWQLNSDGVLSVSGSGDMWDWDGGNMPWIDRLEDVTVILLTPGVTGVGDNAFAAFHSLRSVTFPDGLPRLGMFAFMECVGLTEVSLPITLTAIEDGAFECCSGLTEITIPAGVTVLGPEAFLGCEGLETLVFLGSAPTIGVDAFLGVTATAYYPAGDPSWTEEIRQNYGGRITWVASELPVASGQCGDDLHWELSGDGVLTVSGAGDMWEWQDEMRVPWNSLRSSIKEVKVTPGVTGIGPYAFCFCQNLEQVSLPEGLTVIGVGAFQYSPALVRVDLPEGLTLIGAEAFSGDRALSSLEFPSTLEKIGNGAFAGCEALTELRFPEGLKIIAGSAFYYCTGLTKVTIPDGLELIGNSAFSTCTALEELWFLGSAPSFGAQVFASNENTPVTATVYYPSGDESWMEEILQSYGGRITWVSYPPEPGHTPGDVNGDGAVNNKDLTRLQRYLKGESVEAVAAALDVNGDSTINNKDATRLQRFLKGENVEIH